MHDNEIDDGRKDYIVGVVEEMDEEELVSLAERFNLIDYRKSLINIIMSIDEDSDELQRIYTFTRDGYWSGDMD